MFHTAAGAVSLGQVSVSSVITVTLISRNNRARQETTSALIITHVQLHCSARPRSSGPEHGNFRSAESRREGNESAAYVTAHLDRCAASPGEGGASDVLPSLATTTVSQHQRGA
ncbi:hypothetical protein EYF80_059891 [Liparis tanakae]|uniref:Uncharacterized protein n=1 Tax=Liparis tanakae TaxID=230148 RepID=A0A4Z2EN21_9TELE|nr:hypothetical protein EYF80_059891 [Liparis tanakae]